MPTVFIPQVPSRLEGEVWVPTADVTPAREFGELIHIMPMGMNLSDPAVIVERLTRGLEDFSFDDYLLLLGDPVVIATASAIISARQGNIHLLKWDRRMKRYFKYTINC